MEVYVSTYKKYNSGDLKGVWLNLDNYKSSEEFYKACYEIYEDENDPKYMFLDVENEFDWEEELFNVKGIDNTYWDILNFFKRENYSSKEGSEILDAYLEFENIKSWRNCFNGFYKSFPSKSSLIYHFLRDEGCPNDLFTFIDQDRYLDSIKKYFNVIEGSNEKYFIFELKK